MLQCLHEAIQFHREYVVVPPHGGEIINSVESTSVIYLETGLKNLNDYFYNGRYHLVEEMFLKRFEKQWTCVVEEFEQLDIIDKRDFCIEYWNWISSLRQFEGTLGQITFECIVNGGNYLNRILSTQITSLMVDLEGVLNQDDMDDLLLIAGVNLDSTSLLEFRLFLTGRSPGNYIFWYGDGNVFDVFEERIYRYYEPYVPKAKLRSLIEFWFKGVGCDRPK